MFLQLCFFSLSQSFNDKNGQRAMLNQMGGPENQGNNF